jgi:dTDP-glucose 4,6-dehydratase
LSILVTGGAGFIGSNLVIRWLESYSENIVNLDKLTYAGSLASLAGVAESSRHHFTKGDICDKDLVAKLLKRHRVRAVVHLAAESHVDRSIHEPEDFIRTNVNGTFRLLEAARNYWEALPGPEREQFRFINVSTDEVFGSLDVNDPPFNEDSQYRPNSPYSASKAAADHLARSYFHTYGMPVITTHCSNNYGPRQFPEKLIPVLIMNCVRGEPLPVYGDGGNVRDWLFVDDHCDALWQVLKSGVPGDTYNIGGNCEMANIDLIQMVCELLDRIRPGSEFVPHSELIDFVADRPGHDRRYAIDATKMREQFGWQPKEDLKSGLIKTIAWYLENGAWIQQVTSGDYQKWIEKNYTMRAQSP